MLSIAIGGIGILAALGAVVGYLSDRRAREDAWRRIAAARRMNAERARQLRAREAEMDEPDPAV
jgi:hypothetical protein